MYIDRNASDARSINVVSVLFLVYYSLSTIMPAVSQYISAYLYMGTVVILYAVIFMKNRETFDFYFVFMLPMFFLLLLQLLNIYFNRTGSIPLFLYSQLLYFIPLLLMYYMLYNNKRSLIKILIVVMLSAYVITSFTTYIGLLKNPNAARILATIADSKDPDAVACGRLNIGGFETIYSMVILFPMVICLYKKRKIPLLIFIGITIIFAFCILQSQYATALILFFSSFILLLIRKEFKMYKMWYLAAFTVLSYFLFKAQIAKLMGYLSYNVQSTILSERFAFIADALNGVKNESDVGNRIKLYQLSINSFLKYPVSGTFVSTSRGIGGHSFILDTLGRFGLMGVLALLLFFRQIFTKLYHPFRNTEYFGYMVWCFILYILLSFLNPTGFLIVLGFIVPGLAYLLQDGDYKVGLKGAPYLEDNVGDK